MVGIHYYTFTDDYCLHSHRITDEESRREEKIMNDDAFVCNIQLAAANIQLVVATILSTR